MKSKIITVLVVVVIIIGVAGGYYMAKNRNVTGTLLTPNNEIPVTTGNSNYFLQRDEAWKDVKIGKSTETIGKSGCLICSVAVALNKLGYKTDPADLNKRLTEINGFQGASLIWYKISELYPKITYKYTRSISSKDIQRYLEKGLNPIVKVKYAGNGAYHWVLIVGSTKEDFLIYDPLDPSQKAIALKTHGKVYSYSVLIKKGG